MHFTSDSARQVNSTYTINTANTWEKKVLLIPADTGGSGISNDNGEGWRSIFYLGRGSDRASGSTPTSWQAYSIGNEAPSQTVNIADNTANDWSITGYQLEVGSAATPFEHRSYGETLALCQRYYYQSGYNGGTVYGGGSLCCVAFNANEAGGPNTFPVTMRAAPTVNLKDTAGNVGGIHRAGIANVTSGVVVAWTNNADSQTKAIGGVAKAGAWATGNVLIGGFQADAEL